MFLIKSREKINEVLIHRGCMYMYNIMAITDYR